MSPFLKSRRNTSSNGSNNGRDNKQRLIGFCVSAVCTVVFLALALAFVATVLVKPAPFAFFFTLGNISAIVATFFVVGPRKQLKSMCEPARLIATLIYVAALIFTLVSALAVCAPFTPHRAASQQAAQPYHLFTFLFFSCLRSSRNNRLARGSSRSWL